MGVQSIEVVSIPVSDQDKAKQFYTETLGFGLEIDAGFSEDMRWVQLSPPAGGARIVLMTWNQEMAAGSLKDLYLSCEDIADTYRTLQQRGVQFTDEPFDSPYGKFAHFQDPDGNGWVLHEG